MANDIDFEAALLDPASVFAAPEDVLEAESLSREEKIEILRRWEYDASEIEVAEEEGMISGAPSLVQRIVVALNTLAGSVDMESSPPTKQRGIPKSGLDRSGVHPSDAEDETH